MCLPKNLLLGLVICCSSIVGRADYRLDNWTTDQGLPQNSVYSIVQTRDNYLWMATLDGLVRFDGARFTVFNKSNSPGISNNRFVYLFEDAQGDLWAGTEQSGIVRLHEGRFTSYGLDDGLPSLRVVWLSGDSNGSVVVYPPGMSPAVTWSGERFVTVESRPLTPTVSPQVSQAVFCERNDTGSECYQGTAHRTFPFAEGFPDFRSTFFYNSASGPDGSIWIPSASSQLLRIDTDRTFREFTPRDGIPDFPIRMITGGPRIKLLASDKNGALWMTDVASMQKHLLAVDAPQTLLKPEEVRAAFEDREGNTWFGTTRGGLFRARKQSITAYSKPQGLTLNNIYPIFEDSRGVVWIGTTLGGLFKYADGIFSQVKGGPIGDIYAIAEDHMGRLIVSGGSRMWAVENGQVIHLFDTPQIRIAYALYEQSDGAIWVGGQGGLVRSKDGASTVYTTKDGLAGDEVKVIIGDGAGGLWIGAYGGLTHYKDGQFKSWTEADGLPSTIRSLYQDSDGVLWIGTYDAGLARSKDGKFTTFNMKDGLYNDGVFQILEDSRRNFWISSNRGIYRVNKDELNDFADGKKSAVNSIGYGKSDGMLSLECNGGRSPAGTKTRDGKLWFPTQDGVAVIDPENITIYANPPPVAIEGLKIDNKPLAVEKLFTSRQDPKYAIEIAPHQQNFEVEYTALSFINAENSRFKYKLDGLQDDWVDAGTRRTAYFSFVPPGDYTFRVIAANSDGIWNEEGKSVRIRVLPPFYKTWWFLTLALLSVGGIIYSGFRVRLDRLEQARKAQEEFSRKLLASQEQERQRISAELHDSLGQSLLIIKNRIALAQSDVEEKEMVREQLTELSHSAAAAIDECRDIAYNLRPFQISRFGLSKTLSGMFTRIGDVTRINAIAKVDNIDDLLTEDAQTNVFRIVQECVNNIIKHSKATSASLTVRNDNGTVDMLINDNGCGFDPHDNAVPADKKGGFGLIGMAERVKMLEGTYHIDSGAKKGTSIHIRLNGIKNNGG